MGIDFLAVKMDFSITLLSNSSLELYDNTLSSFTNLLNKAVNVDNQWVVGLSEIYLNNSGHISREKRGIPCEYVKTYSKNLEDIKTLLKDFIGPLDTVVADDKTVAKKKRSEVYNLFEYIDSIFHPISNLTEKLLEQTNLQMDYQKYYAEFMDYAFIYTDIIQSRHVGDQLSRCLKVIPIKNCENFYRFERIEYFPLQTNILKDISILVTNGTGEKINFENSNIPTFCTLHFKKYI